jgi:uncharacterized membrane protein
MESKFAFARHPLHPALVALPIGLFAWTFATDLIYLTAGRDHQWYAISFWSGIAALISALVAALPGFGDYFTMARRTEAAGIAGAHMLLNLAVLTLFFVAMLLALNDNATSGANLAAMVILHGVALGLLAISGWLGGEMVYKHHLAVAPFAEPGVAEPEAPRRYGDFRPGLHRR